MRKPLLQMVRTRHHSAVTSLVAAEETLPAEATSAARARRLVRDALRGTAGEGVLEAALVAISEIVTNALVHAGTPMRLRILLDGGLRVELTDGNPRLPHPREFATTANTGRGLLLVEEMVTRWGANPVPGGKVVWFEIADEVLLEEILPPAEEVAVDDAPVVIELHRMPLLMHHAWQEHAAALLRELMLVRLDAELSALSEHASASDALGLLLDQVPAPAIDLEPDAVMENATEPRMSVQRLLIEIPQQALPSFDALDILLDEALHLADDGALLSPPTQPEIQAMRMWIVHQIRSQAAGGRSIAWQSLSATLPPTESLPPPAWDTTAVELSVDALLVADDASRILAVSKPALALLGHEVADQVVGRRLVTIIPERFHQAHVAGFTLHLLNGRSPLLGKRVTLPVVRADGEEVELGVLIEPQLLPDGRTVFVAQFFEQ